MFKYIKYTPITDEYTTHSFNDVNDKCKLHRFDMPYVSVEYVIESDFGELMAAQSTNIQAIEITKVEFEAAVKDSAQVKRMYSVANEYYKELMQPITSIYTEEERATWMSQFNQSTDFMVARNELVAPLIVALAIGDGVTTEQYATLILRKKSEFDAYSAQALALKRGKLYELMAEVGL